MPPEPRQRSVQCWECEASTDSPIVVKIQVRSGTAGKLALCPSCYQTAYLPLAADGSGTLFVDVKDVGRRLPR